jgi:DNA-binding PadR family transcriptional regulator
MRANGICGSANMGTMWEHLAVRALGADAYGAQLQRTLERETRRAVSLGAVHTVLELLEAKGYIESEASDPTAERGGPRRRVFSTTRKGRETLRQVEAVRQRLLNYEL